MKNTNQLVKIANRTEDLSDQVNRVQQPNSRPEQVQSIPYFPSLPLVNMDLYPLNYPTRPNQPRVHFEDEYRVGRPPPTSFRILSRRRSLSHTSEGDLSPYSSGRRPEGIIAEDATIADSITRISPGDRRYAYRLDRSLWYNTCNAFVRRTVYAVNHDLTNSSFHDFTSSQTLVSAGIRRLLGRHVSFAPTPRQVNKKELGDCIPYLKRSIRLAFQFRGDGPARRPIGKGLYVPNTSFQAEPADYDVEDIIAEIPAAIDQYALPRASNQNLTRDERELLSEIRKRQDLRIVMTDKNLGPALFETDTYISLCLAHLRDTNTYRQLEFSEATITYWERRMRILARQFVDKAKKVLPMNQRSTLKIVLHDINKRGLGLFYALS